ncbi:hypothetical protein BBI17_007909 [Phytophthora kernoviae]|uniref:Uncharacterized protein n=1 Tax=Phytophthora kernoviae TaxID=325452 RepID=A0A421F6K7_9STRA|nr:hypothetical protein JM18_009714 [Phytophthora kernoviae]KAG2517119.1 hypothetical protein JM16_007540 [Phytophthora kernoviae]RLN26436.1 hypothetical protein BBI17_007909 [Phytophthora kernoviae]
MYVEPDSFQTLLLSDVPSDNLNIPPSSNSSPSPSTEAPKKPQTKKKRKATGVESLEQVYNALIFYLTNMEISISERLGHITVRDDYDSIEGTAYNSRIASTEDCGVTMEMNAVSFPQLFAKDELGVGVGPCAVLASDCVDEDELYPYNPSERVRKDVSGAVVLTVSRRKPKHKNKGVGATLLGEESEVVVTMQRAAFVKLHRPQFPVSAFALQELHEGIARWGDVMLKTVRSVVYTTP